MTKKLINKNLIPIIQTIGASLVLGMLFGIYDKLGKMELIQDRQNRQGVQQSEMWDMLNEQGKKVTFLEVTITHQEEQIKELQNERRNSPRV